MQSATDAFTEDVRQARQIGYYTWIGCWLAVLGLFLISRRLGGWRAIEPPAEVILFWILFTMLELIAFIFVL